MKVLALGGRWVAHLVFCRPAGPTKSRWGTRFRPGVDVRTHDRHHAVESDTVFARL